MINKNPNVENNAYGYYRDKPYFNVLFEDKAGFDAEEDWLWVAEYFGISPISEKEYILPQDTYDQEI
jgi:hypothetical protein